MVGARRAGVGRPAAGRSSRRARRRTSSATPWRCTAIAPPERQTWASVSPTRCATGASAVRVGRRPGDTDGGLHGGDEAGPGSRGQRRGEPVGRIGDQPRAADTVATVLAATGAAVVAYGALTLAWTEPHYPARSRSGRRFPSPGTNIRASPLRYAATGWCLACASRSFRAAQPPRELHEAGHERAVQRVGRRSGRVFRADSADCGSRTRVIAGRPSGASR